MGKDISQHLIKDPIYGSMSASAEEHRLLKPFIDHPLMQRLRHIKQLSFVDLIFPGAAHTRFNHSLGCSYLCSRIYKQLHPKDTELGEEHKLIILAELLHDIGHGPFSHAFENIKILKDKKIKHEDWFSLFVDDMFSAMPLSEQYLREDLVSIFNKSYKGASWISSVISSQIDADRMDYILRDSHFCGVKYGVYDLEWLLSCMELFDGKDLVITEKGVGSAEQFLHARSLMYKNVYYHLKSSAIAKCVIDFLDNLLIESNSIEKIIPSSRLVKFIMAMNKHKDSEPELFKSLIYPEYKYLVDYDVWYAIREIALHEGDSVCHQLAKRLYNRDLPKAFRIKPESVDFVKQIVDENAKKLGLESWQIAVVTQNICFYQESKEPVYILDGMGVKLELHDTSSTVARVSNHIDTVPFLYIDKFKYELVKDLILQCNKQAAFVYE